jgi:hypothetical protein
MMVTHSFKVVGTGRFPLDMLRRDQCFPSTEDDAERAEHTKAMRIVSLTTYRERDLFMPTVGRWESFGWKVIEIDSRPFSVGGEG